MAKISPLSRLFILIGLFFSCTASAERMSRDAVIMEFAVPKSPQSIIEFVRQTNLHPKELQHRHEDILSVYTIPPKMDIEDAVINMAEKHEEFLHTSVSSLNEELSLPSRLADRRNKMMLLTLKAKFISGLREIRDGQFRISAITLENEFASSDTSEFNGVDTVDQIQAHRSIQARNTLRTASSSHESWAPYFGTSKVTKGMTFQTFYFDKINGFGSSSTYEHETQVYNVNFANYDNYWSSNLPSAYYDTPFADSIDNFTIGSARASSLRTYTQYYTYMSLRAGSASSATTRIKGQLGHRNPSWCYSTWCIFADATTSSLVTFTAPTSSTLSWSY